MQIEVSWTELKRHSADKGIAMQWVVLTDRIIVVVVDSALSVYSTLAEDSVEALEFNATFKGNTSKRIENVNSPFASKLVGNKKLYARTTGLSYTVVKGINTLSFTIPFPWVKIVGIEVIGASSGDTIDLKIRDTSSGQFSTIPNQLLNQFGFAVNVAPNYYLRESNFDADLYKGMVLEFGYNSTVDGTIGINLLLSEVK